METRNTNLEKNMDYYLERVSEISHPTLKAILQTQLTYLARKQDDNNEIPSLSVLHLPKLMLIPEKDLSLTRKIIRFLNPKKISLDSLSFDKENNCAHGHLASLALPGSGIKKLLISTTSNTIFSTNSDKLMTPDVLTALFDVIKATTSIIALDFSNHDLTGVNAPLLNLLFSQLKGSRLSSLELRHNNLQELSDKQWQAFCDTMRQSKTILTVDISHNHLSYARKKELKHLLHEKNKLAHWAALSIARHYSLFEKLNLPEVLPEACIEQINKARASLT